MADARRFIELGMAPELAKELAKAINEGGGVDPTVAWDDVADKPAVIAAGDTQAAARSAIGAGTSNLAIGTTASTAKAGNYVPSWDDVTGKPATFPPVIGTTATTAKAGNAVQTAAQTTATAIAPGTATNVQGILAELAARIAALEAASE